MWLTYQPIDFKLKGDDPGGPDLISWKAFKSLGFSEAPACGEASVGALALLRRCSENRELV